MLEYPSCSSCFWRAFAVLSDECVGQFDELSHEGCQSNFGGFSIRYHRLVFLPQIRVEAGGDEREYIERIAQELAPALYECRPTVTEDAPSVRATMATARLSGHGSETGQARDLFARQGSDFRTFDEDRDRSDPTQPRDRTENVEGACAPLALARELQQRVFQFGEPAFDLSRSGSGLALRNGQGLRFGPVEESSAFIPPGAVAEVRVNEPPDTAHGVQAAATLKSMSGDVINATHGAGPEIGWPAMTMDLRLLVGAQIDGVAVGQDVMMV